MRDIQPLAVCGVGRVELGRHADATSRQKYVRQFITFAKQDNQTPVPTTLILWSDVTSPMTLVFYSDSDRSKNSLGSCICWIFDPVSEFCPHVEASSIIRSTDTRNVHNRAGYVQKTGVKQQIDHTPHSFHTFYTTEGETGGIKTLFSW